MSNKQIIVVDSAGAMKQVYVEAARYAAFDSQRDRFNAILAADAMYKASDAQETLSFLVSQLAYTESQSFERLYQPMQYEQFIPISTEAGEWADSVRYEIYDSVGQGKRHSGKSKDIPKVDVSWADKTVPVVNGAIGYDYTQEELRRTAFLRRALPERKLAAAIEGYKRHLNVVGLYGEAASGLTGLFNNTLVPRANATTGNWATATPAQMLADVNVGINAVWNNTAFNDFPTDIILPPAALSRAGSTARSDNSDKTVLQYLKENNIAKLQRGIDINFQPGYGLNTAGQGSTARALFYVKNPNRLVMHVPMPLRFLAPQLVGLSVEIPGEYKYAGVEFRYPSSAYYMDGL